MPHTKQIEPKKNHNKFQKKLGIGVFILAAALSPLVIYSFLNPSNLAVSDYAKKATTNVAEGPEIKSDLATQDPDYKDITEVEDASSEMDGEWLGLCKKNSIKSVEDFQRTVLNDKVLLAHYSGFDWNNASLGKHGEAILAFVSHRKGDVIKKTSKPIKLPKGDGYITDGTLTARTFCCNDIILSPAAGPPPEDVVVEPSSGMFPVEEVTLAPLPLKLPLETVSLYRESYPPRKSHQTIFRNPPDAPPTQPIPEPATLILFGTGLFVLVITTWKKNSTKKSE
jgi:hypothetical protein